VLEDGNVKLASVATNAHGKSGRARLEDIITGEDDPEHVASLALGQLRVRIPQLRLASEGKIRSHHRFFAEAFTGSNAVCGTRNRIARKTPRGHRPTKTGAVASGCSLGHHTGGRSNGSEQDLSSKLNLTATGAKSMWISGRTCRSSFNYDLPQENWLNIERV
jgi:hypothetical protein